MEKTKVFIALDVGTGHIGVAASDPLGITANPIDVIECNGNEFQRIKDILNTHNSSTLIVGLPKTLKGKVGMQAEKVLQFVEELRKYLSSVEIIFWDERFTSVIAHRMFRKAGINSRKERKIKDAAEATLILQSYLDSAGRKKRKNLSEE